MTSTLPHLSDEEKQALCLQLERWGLLYRDAHGQRRLTTRGHHAGCMLYAIAMLERAERHENAHQGATAH